LFPDCSRKTEASEIPNRIADGLARRLTELYRNLKALAKMERNSGTLK